MLYANKTNGLKIISSKSKRIINSNIFGERISKTIKHAFLKMVLMVSIVFSSASISSSSFARSNIGDALKNCQGNQECRIRARTYDLLDAYGDLSDANEDYVKAITKNGRLICDYSSRAIDGLWIYSRVAKAAKTKRLAKKVKKYSRKAYKSARKALKKRGLSRKAKRYLKQAEKQAYKTYKSSRDLRKLAVFFIQPGTSTRRLRCGTFAN